MMTNNDIDQKLAHLSTYLGAAYKAIASIEKRVSSVENEVVQHDVKLHDIPAYLPAAKPSQRVSALPEGYAIHEAAGLYYWRRTIEPLARAPLGEFTEDLARIQAAYHFVRTNYETGK